MGSKRRRGAPSPPRPPARSLASDRKTYLMHGKVSQCTGFTFTTVIFIMVFRSLCSLYSTAYKMPLLSVHNILGRAGGVCAVLFTTTILRFYSAIKLLTSLFSLPLSFLRVRSPTPSVRRLHARACVCVSVR
jgi:uncharacterized membrane protein YkvI